MKKIHILAFCLLSMITSLFSQTTFKRGEVKNIPNRLGSVAISSKQVIQDEAIPQAVFTGATAQFIQSVSRGTDDILGTTGYDLQTNGAMMRRIATRPNGDVSAAWTFSLLNATPTSGWPTRGTGYQVRRTNAWNAAPTTRLEGTIRTGFTNLVRLNSTKDLVVAHGGTPFAPVVTLVNDDGTKSTQTLKTVPMGALWHRVATDGNTIHIIGVSWGIDANNNPTPYLGVPGHLLYWRSKDGGTTWDKEASVIPGIDSTSYKTGLAGDGYSISARDGRVVIGIFNGWNDSDLYVSENGGDSFSKFKTLVDFPLDNYVADSGYDATTLPGPSLVNDSTAIFTTDQAGNVIIDNFGLIHCVYSTTYVFDQDLTDNGTNFYPGTSGMFYWAEGMAEPEQILPNLFDFDGDGAFGDPDNPDADLRTAGAAATSLGVLSVDENNHLFLTFRSAYELSVYTTDNEHLNHTFIVSSTDSGETWNGPVDLFWPGFYGGDALFHELANGSYASMEEHCKSDSIRIVYQRDFEPDTYVNSLQAGQPPHTNTLNDIVYFAYSIPDLQGLLTTGTRQVAAASTLAMKLSPNPTAGITNLTFKLDKSAEVGVEIVHSTGQVVYQNSRALYGAGINQISLNTSDLPSGMYMVRLLANNTHSTIKLIVNQ